MNLRLDTSIQYVPRVGPRMAATLGKLSIKTVQDLLFYPPFRYNDFSRIVPISSIVASATVTVEGTVQSIRNVFTKTGKKFQEAVVGDKSGYMTVIWFNQVYLPKVIHTGDRISLSGKIGFWGHKIVMESPAYEIHKEEEHEFLHTGRFVPVYSETAGVTSKWIRGRIAYLLSIKHTFLTEMIPRTILQKYHLPGISEALSFVHFPENLTEAETGRRRLAFDELFYLQLTSTVKRKKWQQLEHAPKIKVKEDDIRDFIQNLPFRLTDDQKKAIRHIASDIQKPYPMNRLLEGDVGSGKTVIAAFSLYMAYKNNLSSVLMAPTQILAQQHYQSMQQLLSPFTIPVHLVMRGSTKNSKSQMPDSKQINNLKSQKNKKNKPLSTNYQLPAIFVGTHALLQERAELSDIGVVVVDEQQRFGVAQRTVLKNKGTNSITPHFLTMTATPIPRTLALTVYGNLDLSVLSEMPKGRRDVKTWVVPKEKRPAAYEWIRKELNRHDCRVFIVCPFIEESESLASVKAVKKEFDRLKKDVFPDISIGLLHGKLKPKEKNDVLDEFRKGDIKILVTTPVVEVGIDIKEASIMVIEGADRFGLSQLHQLRGRVGRGDLTSYCLLFSETTDEKTLNRLKILQKVNNGPELSEFDLLLRGEGDILGFRQHGLPPFTLASLKDRQLVQESQEAVKGIIDSDPDLSHFPLLREKVEKGTIREGIQD